MGSSPHDTLICYVALCRGIHQLKIRFHRILSKIFEQVVEYSMFNPSVTYHNETESCAKAANNGWFEPTVIIPAFAQLFCTIN